MEFTKQSCEDFAAALASRAPVPGGGGASAYVGALGIALGAMAGELSLGKKNRAAAPRGEDLAPLVERAGILRRDLIGLVARDAEAFEPLARAYGLPGRTGEEKAEKEGVMEAALREAALVPLKIMEKCGEAIELHREFAEKTAPMVVSDVGCGALFCRAALRGASLNLFINTRAMKDRALAEDLNRRAETLLENYDAPAAALYDGVEARLRGGAGG